MKKLGEKMKTVCMIATIAMFLTGTLLAEGRLLKRLDFDSQAQFQVWPEDSVAELDDENPKEGKTAIVFTPDNNFVAYFYYPVTSGHEYQLKFWIRMEAKLIPRCGISIAYAKIGGGNGSAGRQSFPAADLAPADNQWHECSVTFTAPDDAVKAQVMFAMHRANATVFIDDARFYDNSRPAAVSAATGLTVSRGELIRKVIFDKPDGLLIWPNETKFDFRKPDGETGRSALVVTPDNSYSAYFYQKLTPGKYTVEFDWIALEKPIPRCALIVFYTSRGGTRGDLGNTTIPLATLSEADGAWKHAVASLVVPENVGDSCQVMLALWRTNTTVQVADLKIYRETE